jgi:serine/threonine-protein kinase
VSTFGLHDHALFRYDFDPGTLSRLTRTGWATLPVWSPDGSELTINLAEQGARNLFRLPASGGEPQRLTTSPNLEAPSGWTPDGKSLVFFRLGDIYVWSADADPQVRAVLRSPFTERHADLSPDGRWLAFSSDDTGRSEVYVTDFPAARSRRAISARGGVEPAWSGDGRTLVFLEPLAAEGQGYRMQAVAVSPGTDATFGRPQELFEIPWYSGGNVRRAYDLTRDAGRFLFQRETYPPAASELDRIRLILNWTGRLNQRAAER